MAISVRGMAPYLQVFDMATSLRFYRDVVGFDVAAAASAGNDADWVLLRLDGVELMLNTVYERERRPAVPDPVRRVGHKDTAIYFTCPDVEATYRHLRDRGADVEPPIVTGYGFKAVRLIDPDGFCLWFHWPITETAGAHSA